MSRVTVPAVGDVAVTGDTALVRGYAAWFLARMLDRYPGGVETLLARSGVPLERRDDVLRACEALGHVGALWRMSTSASGSAEGAGDVEPLLSGRAHGGLLTPREASVVLGIGDRQVRALGLSLGGRRDSGGRWWFSAEEIERERKRREMRGAA